MNQQVEALSKFRTEDIPDEIRMRAKRSKFVDLVVALKNLASDKSIVLDRKRDLGDYKKLQNFKTGLRAHCKKFGMKVDVVEKAGSVYVFTRN